MPRLHLAVAERIAREFSDSDGVLVDRALALFTLCSTGLGSLHREGFLDFLLLIGHVDLQRKERKIFTIRIIYWGKSVNVENTALTRLHNNHKPGQYTTFTLRRGTVGLRNAQAYKTVFCFKSHYGWFELTIF